MSKLGYTKVNRDGSTVHFVEESTWKNIKEQLGLRGNFDVYELEDDSE